MRQEIDSITLNQGSSVMWTAKKGEMDDVANRIAKDKLTQKMSDQMRFDNRAISSTPISGEQIAADIRQKRRSRTDFLVFDGNGSSQMSPEEWVKERRKNDISA